MCWVVETILCFSVEQWRGCGRVCREKGMYRVVEIILYFIVCSSGEGAEGYVQGGRDCLSGASPASGCPRRDIQVGACSIYQKHVFGDCLAFGISSFFWKHSRCASVRQDHLLGRIPFLDFAAFNSIFQNYIELFAKCGWDSFPWRPTSNPSGFNFSKLVPSRQGSRGARDAIFCSELFFIQYYDKFDIKL